MVRSSTNSYGRDTRRRSSSKWWIVFVQGETTRGGRDKVGLLSLCDDGKLGHPENGVMDRDGAPQKSGGFRYGEREWTTREDWEEVSGRRRDSSDDEWIGAFVLLCVFIIGIGTGEYNAGEICLLYYAVLRQGGMVG